MTSYDLTKFVQKAAAGGGGPGAGNGSISGGNVVVVTAESMMNRHSSTYMSSACGPGLMVVYMVAPVAGPVIVGDPNTADVSISVPFTNKYVFAPSHDQRM